MRSVIICLLSLLFVPALGAIAGNQGLPSLSSHPPSALNWPSARLPSVNRLAAHQPRIHLAPMNPPSHQLPIHQPSIHQPSIHQPPTNTHPPPPHGQIVAYQANTGRQSGVILGSQPDQHNKFKVAPVNILGHNSQGPVLSAPYNQVAKVHQNDLVGTNMMAPSAASHLMRFHAQNPPVEMHATAPTYGSRYHAALHGSARPVGRR